MLRVPQVTEATCDSRVVERTPKLPHDPGRLRVTVRVTTRFLPCDRSLTPHRHPCSAEAAHVPSGHPLLRCRSRLPAPKSSLVSERPFAPNELAPLRLFWTIPGVILRVPTLPLGFAATRQTAPRSRLSPLNTLCARFRCIGVVQSRLGRSRSLPALTSSFPQLPRC